MSWITLIYAFIANHVLASNKINSTREAVSCCASNEVLQLMPELKCVPSSHTSLHTPYVASSTDTYYLINSTYIEELPYRDTQYNGNDLVTIVGYANSNGSKSLQVFPESTLFIMGSPVIMKDQFTFGEYCIEELEYETNFTEKQELQNYSLVAKVCNPCANKPCVKKCCAAVYFINSTTSSWQKFENLELNKMPIRLMDINGNDSQIADYLAIPIICYPSINVISCPSYKINISLVQNRNDFYVMKDSGLLRASNHMDKNKLFQDYYNEYFIKDGSEPKIKVYFCEVKKDDGKKEEKSEQKFGEVFVWFHLTSASFLAATFLVYAVLEKLRKHKKSSMNMMSLVFSMSVMYFGMGFKLHHGHGGDLSVTCCSVLVGITRYFFIASFTWMTIISLDLGIMFRRVQTKHLCGKDQLRQCMYYATLGWGIPLLLEGITQVRLHSRSLREKTDMCCSFSVEPEFVLYFQLPVGILVILNTIIFIWVITSYHKISTAACVSTKYVRKRLFTSCRIFVLMGVSWFMQIIAVVSGSDNCLNVTYVWNTMQGVLFFLILVCKKNVFRMLQEKFQMAIHIFHKIFSITEGLRFGQENGREIETVASHVSITPLSPNTRIAG